MISTTPISEIARQYYKKKGPITGGFEFSTPTLTIADPDLLRDILVKDFHLFPIRREFKLGESVTDKMVSVLTGEDWKRVRTIITPAFTSKRMRQMGSIINECSKTIVETCEMHYKRGEPIDVKGLFGAFTMDVIASAAFATKIDSYNDPENIFVKMVKSSFVEVKVSTILLSLLVPMRILRYFRFGAFKTMDFFKNVTVEVIKERKEKKKRYNDILQVLMDALEDNKIEEAEFHQDEKDQYGSITTTGTFIPSKYKKVSEEELLAQCVMFFFVGYETTGSVLTFMAYALALNPEWQEKLIVEVDEAFQKHSEMSHDAVRDMNVLDAVVSETLRMYPPALATVRTAAEDYKLGDTNIVIEKGIRVNVPIYGMHYDPIFFDEPEKFNPNRFLDPNAVKHPQYSYLPFGAGPRNCLGMRFALLETKLCMANILRHYRFQKHSNTKVPLDYKKGSSFLSVNELQLAVEKRNDVKS